MSKQTVVEALKSHKVSEVHLSHGKVIEIDSRSTLLAAFSILLDNNILSAPVFDEDTKKYVGFLDVRDLVAFAVFAANENEIVRSLQEILSKGAKLHEKAQDGITVTYLCRRNPFKPVTEEASLFEVCKILATGAHRVPVVNADGRVINIVSQSSVVSFFLTACKSDEFLKKTVGEVRLGSSPVLQILESESALHAFKKLDDTGRSGMAVVDGNHHLVSNTSSSDIKLYLKYHEQLDQPILEFLNKIRRLDITQPTRTNVFSCKMEDSIYHVIGKLSATKAHRVFLVDENFRPEAVISLTDIIRLVLSEK